MGLHVKVIFMIKLKHCLHIILFKKIQKQKKILLPGGEKTELE